MAYIKATSAPYCGIICEQNLDEIKRVFNKKFHNHLSLLDRFLSEALLALELIPIPIIENDAERQIRDISDRPILRAALAANADIILTGDKDFLEAGLTKPKVLTPAEFLQCPLPGI